MEVWILPGDLGHPYIKSLTNIIKEECGLKPCPISPRYVFFPLLRNFLKRRPDRVIVHFQWYHPIRKGIIYSFLLVISSILDLIVFERMLKGRARIVWTIHELYHLGSWKKKIHVKLEDLWINALIKKATYVIVHGKKLAQKVMEKFPHCKRKVIEIPLPPEVHFERRIELFQKRRGGERRKFLIFGYMGRYKRHLEVMRLLSELSRENRRKAVLIIAGKCLDMDYLKEIQEEANKINSQEGWLEVKVIPRYLSEEEVIKLFLSVDVVLVTYSGEVGNSGVLTLASYFAKPVVLSNLGCLSEYVSEENRKELMYSSDEELRDILKKVLLMSEEKLKEIGRKNKQVISSFGKEEFARKHCEVYSKCFSQRT